MCKRFVITCIGFAVSLFWQGDSLSFGLLAQDVAANEQKPIPVPSWAPKKTEYYFDVLELALVRITADGQAIEVLEPAYTTQSQTVNRTRMVEERRTETVTVERNGELVTEDRERVEKVPMTETYEVVSLVVVGHYRFKVPLNDVLVQTISGEPVPAAELPGKLRSATKVFLGSREDLEQTTDPRVDPFFLSVYRPETLAVFVSDQAIGEPVFYPYETSILPAPVADEDETTPPPPVPTSPPGGKSGR